MVADLTFWLRRNYNQGTNCPRSRPNGDWRDLELVPPNGGYLVIYVWSTWFSACQRDVPFDFNDLYPRFKDRGLRMVGLSMDYRKQDLLNYIAANQVPYPQVYNGSDLTEGCGADWDRSVPGGSSGWALRKSD